MKVHTSYDVDQKFNDTLERMRLHYGLATRGEVLRKAMGLLVLASRNEQSNGDVIMLNAQSERFVITMREES